MQNIKIKTYQLESKSNEKNEAPIYLRVILDGKYIQLSTGIYIKSEFWDRKKKEVKSRHTDAIRLNLQIYKTKERISDIHYDLKKSGTASLERIKAIYAGKEEKTATLLTLIEYNNNLIKNALGKTYAPATYNQYRTLKKKMARFVNSNYGKSDLDLSDLNLAFITKYEYFLASEYNNSVNAIAKQIDRLKKVIKVGLRNDWLKEDPFRNYEKKTLPTNREYLTVSEVDQLAELDLSSGEHLERVRDVFIFICFTGISYCDLALLTKENIVRGIDGQRFIHVERKKTLEVCNIPLLPRSEEILIKYRNHPISQNKGILLPVISNQKMNDYLKLIGGKAKISKKVSCHIGRHTFATMSLEMGVPIETVSRVLGHRNIKTTQIYAKVTNTKISKDYSLFYVKKNDTQSRVI